jgi:hypothetical protein
MGPREGLLSSCLLTSASLIFFVPQVRSYLNKQPAGSQSAKAISAFLTKVKLSLPEVFALCLLGGVLFFVISFLRLFPIPVEPNTRRDFTASQYSSHISCRIT